MMGLCLECMEACSSPNLLDDECSEYLEQLEPKTRFVGGETYWMEMSYNRYDEELLAYCFNYYADGNWQLN